jgi:hypothetical protein
MRCCVRGLVRGKKWELDEGKGVLGSAATERGVPAGAAAEVGAASPSTNASQAEGS